MSPRARRRVRKGVDALVSPLIGSWDSGSATASVALTLDDGPDPLVTPVLVERLAELDVRATFFLLTLRAERYPGLVDLVAAAGHEIALHGLDHRRVSSMRPREAHDYLSGARDRLEQVAGHPVTLFRPPYGSQSVTSFLAARRAGLQVVVWDGDAADWEDREAGAVAMAAEQACRPGGILLLHERLEPDPQHPDPVRGAPVTTFDRPELIAETIRRVRARGLEPCAVSDLASEGPMHRTAWIRP
jgi:peptidoglycan/xylan/chitin deacetylase (PgdA/CDA1 family)